MNQQEKNFDNLDLTGLRIVQSGRINRILENAKKNDNDTNNELIDIYINEVDKNINEKKEIPAKKLKTIPKESNRVARIIKWIAVASGIIIILGVTSKEISDRKNIIYNEIEETGVLPKSWSYKHDDSSGEDIYIIYTDGKLEPDYIGQEYMAYMIEEKIDRYQNETGEEIDSDKATIAARKNGGSVKINVNGKQTTSLGRLKAIINAKAKKMDETITEKIAEGRVRH